MKRKLGSWAVECESHDCDPSFHDTRREARAIAEYRDTNACGPHRVVRPNAPKCIDLLEAGKPKKKARLR